MQTGLSKEGSRYGKVVCLGCKIKSCKQDFIPFAGLNKLVFAGDLMLLKEDIQPGAGEA
jgi:hypothetical protein